LEQKNIHTTIVLGPGYSHQKTLQETVDKLSGHLFEIIPSTSRISDYMARADIAITSGGRTVLELASLYVPTIVICQNKRETTHAFASEENGVSNLGLWDDTTCEKLLFSFAELETSEEKRNEIRRKLRGLDTAAGKQRVVSRLQRLMASNRKVKKHVITN
jgi:spore coat polysaccharide biosynthesis predicted glycosyltransferase SpsG